jgi:hypothetical protein
MSTFVRIKTGGMSIIVPQTLAAGKPWVMHADPMDRSSAVDQSLLAKGYHLAIPPVTGTGMSEQQWDGIYKLMVDNGFAKKILLSGTGAKAGEAYAWAVANPDKVALIYARNPSLRSLMSKTASNRQSGAASEGGSADSPRLWEPRPF